MILPCVTDLGINIVTMSLDQAKRSLPTAYLEKSDTWQMTTSKCMPTVLCSLDACRLTKSYLSAVEFVIDRLSMNVFERN